MTTISDRKEMLRNIRDWVEFLFGREAQVRILTR